MAWGKILCYIRVFAWKLGSLWRRQWDRNQIRSMHVKSRDRSRIVLREKSNCTGSTTVLANSRRSSGIRAARLSYSRLGQNEKVFALGLQWERCDPSLCKLKYSGKCLAAEGHLPTSFQKSECLFLKGNLSSASQSPTQASICTVFIRSKTPCLTGYNKPYVCVSHSIMSDSLRPHEVQPARLLCP